MNPSNRHLPGKWPFPPSPPERGTDLNAFPQGLAASAARGHGKASFAGRRQMWGDVLLVLAWGAMIPGFMWLGYAAGF